MMMSWSFILLVTKWHESELLSKMSRALISTGGRLGSVNAFHKHRVMQIMQADPLMLVPGDFSVSRRHFFHCLSWKLPSDTY